MEVIVSCICVLNINIIEILNKATECALSFIKT